MFTESGISDTNADKQQSIALVTPNDFTLKIWYFCPPVILFFGTMGNILSGTYFFLWRNFIFIRTWVSYHYWSARKRNAAISPGVVMLLNMLRCEKGAHSHAQDLKVNTGEDNDLNLSYKSQSQQGVCSPEGSSQMGNVCLTTSSQ